MNDTAYDAWFRAKVQEVLDDPRPMISHEKVMKRAAVRRARLVAKSHK